MAVNCNEGTLGAYIPDQNNPWDISKILFLFRRIGFSIKYKEVKNYLNFNPSDLIDQIFEEALNMPISPDPGWANFDNTDFTASGKNRGAFFRDHQKIVFEDFLNNGLRERLTLFLGGLRKARALLEKPYCSFGMPRKLLSILLFRFTS